MMEPTSLNHYNLGHLALTSGSRLENARLAWRAYGRLNRAKGNCVLLPTYYTGTDLSYLPWIGPGQAFDTDRWFVLVVNMFGNGVSSSPSQRPHGLARAAFPDISVVDNVLAQHRLVTEELGVDRLALVGGWSLGAIQAWHWAAMFPDMVESLLAVCGTASCWPLNRVFLEGVSAALMADPTYADGAYTAPPEAGLRAFGRTYCGWAYSAAFFREAEYRALGSLTLEDFLLAWEEEHLAIDAGDLLAMLRTWRSADIGTVPGANGDRGDALGRIAARTIAMPCDQDAYFTLYEAALEVAATPGAELRPLLSTRGHCAGAPGRFPTETAAITTAAHDLLNRL
ncbi:MAG: homoserine O-acetyltransferase [Proteobacteria bacterium]|nr:homoserine O-acetyltransferase [Pseudomonadota bacterium]